MPASQGKFSYWLSLIMRRFGRNKNLGGESRPIEAAAIPTATMIAEWARDSRNDISQVWIFGSAIYHEDWDGINDDLDVLLVVPDKKWTVDSARDIPKQVPLSEHYIKLDVRVCKESECDLAREKLRENGGKPPEKSPTQGRIATIEYALYTGVCVWERGQEPKPSNQSMIKG